MDAADIPTLLILHPANRYYLSGFELHDGQCNESSGCLLIRANGPDWLLTDARFTEVKPAATGPMGIPTSMARRAWKKSPNS